MMLKTSLVTILFSSIMLAQNPSAVVAIDASANPHPSEQGRVLYRVQAYNTTNGVTTRSAYSNAVSVKVTH